MPLKGWILLAFCVLCTILTVQFWGAGMDYNNIILPEGMNSFPVTLFGYHIGVGYSTQELHEYSVAFKWLTLLPLSLAFLSYWKFIKGSR
ncbi:hypothetical protein [Neobacillus niacini]|uniref:hypothetical protein n=1 Tax=Neobacillus niacini TaxID=86668 RepID=UPI0028583DFE|nr:hypothetical protein [Neobacillus niacini]MDR7003004.1 hypothetical protein [Neobacillus niacini]